MKFMNLADILYDPFDQFDYFFYLVSNFGLSNWIYTYHSSSKWIL